jgi:Co/Zn/Cd efflux system component
MKLQNTPLLIVATLALMTNGLSLLGLNHGSAGALARNIECNSSMSRNIQVAVSLKQLPANPPCRPDNALASPFSFI